MSSTFNSTFLSHTALTTYSFLTGGESMWTLIIKSYNVRNYFKVQLMMPAMNAIPNNLWFACNTLIVCLLHLFVCTSYTHPTLMTNQHTREQVGICEQQLLVWFFLFSVWCDVIHTNEWQHTPEKIKNKIYTFPCIFIKKLGRKFITRFCGPL